MGRSSGGGGRSRSGGSGSTNARSVMARLDGGNNVQIFTSQGRLRITPATANNTQFDVRSMNTGRFDSGQVIGRFDRATIRQFVSEQSISRIDSLAR